MLEVVVGSEEADSKCSDAGNPKPKPQDRVVAYQEGSIENLKVGWHGREGVAQLGRPRNLGSQGLHSDLAKIGSPTLVLDGNK